MARLIFIILIVAILATTAQVQVIHAPELVRGASVGWKVFDTRLALVHGGDVLLAVIGQGGTEERGVIIRLIGDTDYEAVEYNIAWKNDHKYNGHILYRGHNRKLCAANNKSNLPCR